MTPAVSGARARRQGTPEALVRGRREAAACIGIAAAVGAYGGFLVPRGFAVSMSHTGSLTAAFWLLIVVYAVLLCADLVLLSAPGVHARRCRHLMAVAASSTKPTTAPATHCPYCALQCAMTLAPATSRTGGRELPLEVRGRDFPTNRGGLCRKGWTSAELLIAPDRLTSPLIKGTDGRQRPASWDEALGLIADRLLYIQHRYGPDAVAMFGGGGLTNEKAYQLGKFARVALRTRYVDYNGRFCMSSAAAAANRSLGVDRGMPFPLADLGGAAAVLLLGSNLAETMPPAVAHLSGARAKGGLIVVDPRRSATATLTDDGAGLHLQPVPGTDMVVLLGLLHLVWARGWADDRYLARRTRGAAEVRALAALWWPERVRTDHRRARRDARARGRHPRCGRPGRRRFGCLRADRSRRRAACERDRHGDAGDRPRAVAGAVRPNRFGVWVHHRPGKRAGRP